MAKQGMKRPDVVKLHPKNEFPPVPQLQGKAKFGNEKAKPIVSGTGGPTQKVWHHGSYAQFDNDLAGENLLNDVPTDDRP